MSKLEKAIHSGLSYQKHIEICQNKGIPALSFEEIKIIMALRLYEKGYTDEDIDILLEEFEKNSVLVNN